MAVGASLERRMGPCSPCPTLLPALPFVSVRRAAKPQTIRNSRRAVAVSAKLGNWMPGSGAHAG